MSTYRVGLALDPQPEDREYGEQWLALEKAQKMADAYGVNMPVAVWEGDRPLWLYFMGEKFRRS